MEDLIKKLRELHQMMMFTVDETWCIQLFELNVAANDMIDCIYESGSKNLYNELSDALEWAEDRVRQSN
ncbi:hypothetical protein [Paenibacillus oryzisoli]|uniref:Uncharacterized protein n=1 Tax=Paenibacillus oryzisoli TaxID=1850517 RepID=A0A198ADL1_9BACL|nr:hypothetical protein [Paenibacillus oryzisoli]OAS19272.1 hypothetical protein A8708_26545 [Paenibacillus oryzisoli]